MIYPDASTLVPLLISEDLSPIAESVFAAADRILASDFTIGEVSSAIARHVRMGERDADSGRQAIAELDEWVARRTISVETHSNDIRVATLLCEGLKPGYDCPTPFTSPFVDDLGRKSSVSTMDCWPPRSCSTFRPTNAPDPPPSRSV